MGVKVAVGVRVGVRVAVGVSVGVLVAVCVTVGVGVTLGTPGPRAKSVGPQIRTRLLFLLVAPSSKRAPAWVTYRQPSLPTVARSPGNPPLANADTVGALEKPEANVTCVSVPSVLLVTTNGGGPRLTASPSGSLGSATWRTRTP